MFMDFQIDQVVDATGLLCPEPVMLLHQAMREATAQQVIKVIATDPSTLRDITKFCLFLGHELLTSEEVNQQYIFYIKKGET